MRSLSRYLVSFVIGCLAGVIFWLLKTPTPGPPLVGLTGLLGIAADELGTVRIRACIRRRRQHHDTGQPKSPREIWLVRSTPLDGMPASAFEAELASHLSWMHDLDQQGLVLLSGPLLSGPLLSGPGVTTGSGVALLRAADEPAACAIAEQDPFVRAGLRTFALHRWRLNEGSLALRVRRLALIESHERNQ